MTDTGSRPARIKGWIAVAGPGARDKDRRFLGGLIELSKTGARLYLTWKPRIGDHLSFGLRIPGSPKPQRMPLKVVRVTADEPGRMDTFEARLQLLREMVQWGIPSKGMTYGFAVGARWEAGASPEGIRFIQRHFEDEGGRVQKQVLITFEPSDEPAVLPQL
ncbi:MAG: PilZ domain-containing protein [Candidatus Coatesbacteria bacterium]